MGGKGKVWWWIVVALFLLAFLWFVPQLQGRYFSQGVPAEEIPALVNEYRRTWAQILGGAALLSGIYFTWRTLQVNREGQITDRFTRAIDQLGKVEDGQKLFEIRVGGIYALERIARESEEDYWPIMQILIAYVRQNAPRTPPRLAEAAQQRTEDATHEQHAEEGSRGKSETTELSPDPSPDPDIEAIMTVLRRRKRYYAHGEPDRLDLSATILSGALLGEVNLSGADLRGADLSAAQLNGADFSGAYIWWALLVEASLIGAILNGADLNEADLSGAILNGADLSGANLSGVNLYGADLSGVQYLTQEQLEQAKGGENTQLPADLKRPAHWVVMTDEQTEGK
jgi:uncharacterized protein YjbI with pentapeptide repeats